MVEKFCLVFFFFGVSNAAKILGVFPIEGKSHFFFHKGIMDALVDAGHQVTIICPFPDSDHRTNFTYINSNVVRNNTLDYWSGDYKSMSVLQFLRKVGQDYEQYCHEIFQLEEVQNLLKSETKIFDAMFLELLPLWECFLPLAEKLGVPIIATFSMRPWLTVDWEFGNPHPLVVPSPVSPLPQKMTSIGRLYNALEEIYTSALMMYLWQPSIKKVHRKYFPNFNLHRNQLSLLFINNHDSIFSRPKAPNVVDIPGIHLKPIKPLPRNLQNFLDDSGDGVILFTFGSVTRSSVIETDLRNTFIETFADLPERVIWKFEDELENLSPNVLRADWVPQRDILAHKNVKAFITHCGISGLYEAIDAGVPLILIPLFGDQTSNAAFFHELEVGILLDFKTLTKEILLSTIKEVLHNEKYAKNMQKLSREFWDRPMSPQKSIVYWTEYVLRHNGTEHIKSNVAETHFYQYFLLDTLSLVLIMIFIFVGVTHHFCQFVYNSQLMKQNNVREYKKSSK